MTNIRLFFFTLLASNLLFASGSLTKIENKNIFGCFNEVTTSKYKATTLVLRNSSLISDDFIVNEKENKNALLVITSYKSRSLETFEVSALKLEGKSEFLNSKDGWNPKLSANTLFTAKGNLKAFSIQDNNQELLTAKYSEFATKGVDLICSSDKKLIESIFLKLISNN